MNGVVCDPRPLAIVLASGGMDSCVTVAEAARGHRPALLHVSYGQRTWRRELKAFHDIADHYEVPKELRLVADIDHLARIGGSSLTDMAEAVADGGGEEAREVPRTYVPFRNGNLISIAASWAEVIGAASIWLGVVEEDSSGYPDCRVEFIRAMERALNFGTARVPSLKLETPLIELDKSDIVHRGLELGAPLHLSWSCYRNEDQACGRCDSCLLRLRGFRLAGEEDRIKYA